MLLKVRGLGDRSEMSGASPKHTKSRRYKACLRAMQTAVPQRGKGVWEAGPTWVRQEALRPILKTLAVARA